MTIASEAARRTTPLLCNGATVTFPFSFRIFATADVDVFLLDDDGAETQLTQTTQYSVSMNSDQDASPGGTITTVATYATGNSLVIASGVSAVQATAIPNASAFLPDVIEQALDRLTTLVIDLKEAVGRCIRLPISDEDAAAALDSAVNRANGWLAFGADGAPFVSSSVAPSSATVSAFMETVLDDTTAAAARTTLGAVSAADVAAQVGAQIFGRNRLFNGDFCVNQRQSGVSPTTSALAFFADMWQGRSSAAPSGTLALSSSSTSSNPGTAKYYAQMSRAAGTYVGSLFAEQVLEEVDCTDLAGKTVTIQAKVRKGSGFGGSQAEIQVITSTDAAATWASLAAGTWAGITTTSVAALAAASLTTSYQTLSGQVVIPAGTKRIAVRLVTTWAAGTGNSTDRLQWTDVQLAEESVASQFERLPFSTQLARCQRYYEKSWNYVDSGASGGAGGLYHRAQGGGTLVDTIRAAYKVTKATNTAPTWYSPSTGASGNIRDTTGAADVATTGTTSNSDTMTGMPNIAGMVAGRLYEAHWDVNCIT